MNPSAIQRAVDSAVPADSPVQLLPFRHAKVVSFVRHGEGFHNLIGDYQNWEYEDAHLTEEGWLQSHRLKEHLKGLASPLQIQAVVVSPLTRAIETAIGAFGGDEWKEGEHAQPLMLAQEARKDKQAAHGAVSSAGAPPFIIHEGCREHLGCNPCDKRSPTSVLQQRYPALDLSSLADAEDQQWKEDERESTQQLLARAVKFVHWLMSRPEGHLAVVTHSSFLYHLMACFGHQAAPPVPEELHRWFNNCELRTVVLSDLSNTYQHADMYHFPGNLPAAEKNLQIAHHTT